MSVGTYTYDQAWQDERERLAGIERLWDEGTFALLERLGVGPQRVTDAVLDLMASMGHDEDCGRKLPSELEALGLKDVQAEGRVRLIGSGTPDTAFFSLSLETLREALVSSGRARDEEIGERLADLAEPGRTFLSPILVACHGQRPS